MLNQAIILCDCGGLFALILITILGSIIIPIPPDTLLIPMGFLNPDMVFIYAALVLIASLLGAAFGHFLGKKYGRAVLSAFFDTYEIKRIEHLIIKHGTAGIIIAGFSPLPYNLITIGAGVFAVPFVKLAVCSIISRGFRFFLIAVIIATVGDAAKDFLLSTDFFYLTLIICIVLAILYVLYWTVKSAFDKKFKR